MYGLRCGLLSKVMGIGACVLTTCCAGADKQSPNFLPISERREVDRRFAEFDALDLHEMPTGDALARHDVRTIPWKDVSGPDVRKNWKGQKKVELRDLALRIKWPEPTDKSSGTLFWFIDCEEVIVENVSVIHAAPDYRGQHTFLFEGCGKVVLRNCFSAGATERSHIRLEGCGEYFIEKTEISGWDYGDAGVRCGAGIFVNNGITAADGSVQVTAAHPRELDWGVIRDCWFHDYLANDGKWKNHDGILLHAPSNGIVFNCAFDRWKAAADGAMDVSHRRHDDRYHNKVHRTERCVFRDCEQVKTNGATGNADCVVVWANNVYVNTWLSDYHRGWNNWHIHETYVFENRSPALVKNWGIRDGLTILANGLVVAPQGLSVAFFQSNESGADGFRSFRTQNLLYLMPPPGRWVSGEGTDIRDRAAWLAQGLEQNGSLALRPPGFSNPTQRDFRLSASSPAAGSGSPLFVNPTDLALRVARDFVGNPRPNTPSAGAFEVVGRADQAARKRSAATGKPSKASQMRHAKDAPSPRPEGSPSTLRAWSDNTGQHRIEAEFLGLAAGSVKLRKASGETISIPIERLSTEDQAWVRQHGR